MWSSSPTPELEADRPHRRPQRDPKQRLSSFNGAVLAFLLGTIALGTLLVATGHALALDLILWLSYVKLYISTTKMVPQAWINYRRKSTVGWSIENILLDFTGGVLSLCVVPSASSRSRSTARPTVARLADLAAPSLPPSLPPLSPSLFADRVQLFIDSWVDGDLRGIIGNPGKLCAARPFRSSPPNWADLVTLARSGLGLLALGFDILFMLQHFVLYRNARVDADPDRAGDEAGAQPSSSSSSGSRSGTAAAGENEPLLGSRGPSSSDSVC